MSNNLNRTEVAENLTAPEPVINSSDGLLDQALTEFYTVNVSSGNQNVSAAQSRVASVFITGAADARTVTFAAAKRKLNVFSASANAAIVTLKCGTTEFDLSPGDSASISLDGTANGMHVISGGSGSGLPPVTTADNGKVAKVVDGEWGIGDDLSGGGDDSGALTLVGEYTYARVYIEAGSGYFAYAFSEIQFLDTEGSVVSTSGATFSASVVTSGSVAALFDGNTSTFWTGGNTTIQTQTAPQWVQVQFPTPKQIVGYTLKARLGSSGENQQFPLRHNLEVSNDGVNWVRVGHFANNTVEVGGQRTFKAAIGFVTSLGLAAAAKGVAFSTSNVIDIPIDTENYDYTLRINLERVSSGAVPTDYILLEFGDAAGTTWYTDALAVSASGAASANLTSASGLTRIAQVDNDASVLAMGALVDLQFSAFSGTEGRLVSLFSRGYFEENTLRANGIVAGKIGRLRLKSETSGQTWSASYSLHRVRKTN